MVVDIRGYDIEVGSLIRYGATGTVSKVVDFKEEDNQNWVKLEGPGLWYRADSLEIISEDDLNEFESDFDTKDAVEKLKEAQLDLADAVNDMQGCEGGG